MPRRNNEKTRFVWRPGYGLCSVERIACDNSIAICHNGHVIFQSGTTVEFPKERNKDIIRLNGEENG